MSTEELVAAIVATLAPFTPFLVEMGKAEGQKLAEVIAERGGEATWKRAQSLWTRLTAHYKNDPEIQSATSLVAAQPANKEYQVLFAKLMNMRLEENSIVAREFIELLGGQQGLQQIIAESGSRVEDILQDMTGSGTQTVKASGETTVITGIKQIKK